MNNKGQVLVLFIILIPVILLFSIVSIQIGSLYLEKNKNTNIIKDAIRETLKNPKTEINKVIEKNIKDIKEKTIFISEDEIKLKITQEKKIFGRTIDIKYNYKGIKQEDKIIISEG